MEFLIPKNNERFRVLHEDGAHYIERISHDIDVILVDAFDADGIAPSLAASHFYARAAAKLTDNGILAMNLWGDRTRYAENVRQLQAVFGKGITLMPVMNGANTVLFAFKRPTSILSDGVLASHAKQLQSHLQLDFPHYLRRFSSQRSLAF